MHGIYEILVNSRNIKERELYVRVFSINVTKSHIFGYSVEARVKMMKQG